MEEQQNKEVIKDNNLLSEETIAFIKKCYLHLNQARHGVWAFADLSDIVWNPKVQKKNKELYFSIIHDAIAYEIIKYEEILEMAELKTDFLSFYSKFVSKINTSHEYSNFLEDRINTLENRFGLVWQEQEEQLLKIVSEDEIVLGVAKFLINKDYYFIKESKDKKKKFIKNKEGKQFILIRKKGDSFLYFCKELNQLFLLYSVQSKINVYSFVENHYTKYYPVLVKKGDNFGFGDVRDNLLIEGDNYFALQLLQFTHKRKINIIYIDPPYNTGNDDFKYNDSYVGLDDSSRHSKWLSFMNKRLKLSKDLLSDNGLLFISIDDNEFDRLKGLCDIIFGEENFISIMPRKTVSHIRKTSENKIQNLNDYVLMYAKNISKTILKKKIVGKIEYDFEDLIGRFELKDFQNSGEDGKRSSRPNLYYPIYYNLDNKTFSIDERNKDIEILPKKVKGEDGRWLWSKEKFIKDSDILIYHNNTIYKKSYFNPEEDQNKYQNEKNWLQDFSNKEGSRLLNKLKLDNFSYPKPIELINFLLNLSKDKNSIVLDFFAGSGTTGHSVLELNKQDNGNRKFILCTNNESNICEDTTYSRLLKINDPKKYNLTIDSLGHGLEYLQIKHISDLDLENADDIGNFEYIKYLNNIKFGSTKIVLENNNIYITDKYSVFKKVNTNKQKEYCDFFDLSIKNEITNIVFVSSEKIEYDYFKKIISKHIETLPENKLFEQVKYYQMSKDYIDNMLSIINGEEEIDLEKHMTENDTEIGEQ